MRDVPSKADLSFEQLELAVLDEFCDRLQSGQINVGVTIDGLEANFGVDGQRAGSLFTRLRGLGAIAERTIGTLGIGSPAGTYTDYHIGPLVCEIASSRRAEIAARTAPTDRVEAVSKWARSHPIWSAALIVLFALTAIATLANQTLQFLKALNG